MLRPASTRFPNRRIGSKRLAFKQAETKQNQVKEGADKYKDNEFLKKALEESTKATEAAKKASDEKQKAVAGDKPLAEELKKLAGGKVEDVQKAFNKQLQNDLVILNLCQGSQAQARPWRRGL